MRNFKRVLSLALAVVMVIGMMVMGAGAADLTDKDQIEYLAAVEVAQALDIIDGLPNGSFNPTGTLTREGAAILVCRLVMGRENADKLVGTGGFADIPAGWYSAGYIEYCVNNGYMSGTPSGNFNPTGDMVVFGFGKLLLCALGYDAEIEGYTGDAYATNIQNDMIEAGIAVDGVAMNAVLTREVAAEMLLNTLTADMVGYTGGMNITTGDTSIKVGATRYVIAGSEAADANWDGEDGDGKMQFCEKWYSSLKWAPVAATANAGLAGYKWTLGTKTIGTYATESVKASYTAGAKFIDIVKAVGVKNDADEDYVVEIYRNGKATDGVYSVAVNDTFAAGEYDGQTLTDTADDFGVVPNGCTVNVVVTKNAAKDTVIRMLIDIEYLGVVDGVVEDNDQDDADERKVVVTAYANGTTTTKTFELEPDKCASFEEIYAAADALKTNEKLYYVIKPEGDLDAATMTGKLLSIKPAATVTGKMTSYNTTTGIYTIGGEPFKMSATASALDITGNANGYSDVYYLDSNGFVLYAVDVETATPAATYALLNQVGFVSTTPTGAIGATAAQYLEAELVFFDGTKQVVKLAMINDANNQMEDATYDKYIAGGETDGKVQNVVALGDLNTKLKNKVVKYAVNDKGLYTLTTVAQDVTGSTKTLADDVKFDGTNLADSTTKFLIKTGSGTTTKYSVVTGYANLNDKLFQESTVTVTGVNYAAPGNTSVAQFVYVTGTESTSSSANTQAFVYGAGTYNYVSSTDAYYEFPVIINGAATTLKVATNNTVDGGAALPTAGSLYNVTTLDAKGYVSVMTTAGNDTIKTAAKNGIVELTSDGWKTYDENTKVYVIDAVAGTVTAADITALDATGGINVGNVYVSYVPNPAGGFFSTIAQIIAVKAVAGI